MMFTRFFHKKRAEGKGSSTQNTYIMMPRYRGGQFASLADAVQSLQEHGDTYVMGDIMQYNIRYRDYLRLHGIDALVELMQCEAPALREDEEAIKEIYKRYEEMGGLADYDIQCYDVSLPIPVLGKQLPLSEIGGPNVEMFLRESYLSKPDPWRNGNFSGNDFGLYLGNVYESYPCFDSDDYANENRSYDNYLIRTTHISRQDMLDLLKVKSLSNFQKVHEHIPEHLLPVLYHDGDHPYALLASKKEEE